MRKWNIKYLHELYKHYKILSQTTDDSFLALEYENTMNSILVVIERYNELNKKISLTNPFLKEKYCNILLNDLEIIQKYGHYCPYIRKLDEYNDLLIIKPNDRLQTINVSDNSIVTLTSSFYRQFKGEIFENYKNMISTFDDTLYLYKLTGADVNCGQTYSLYKTGITCIEIGMNNTVQDYISAIHEMGHGISCSINPEAMWDYEKYCFIELESLFFELIGTDYVGNKLNLKKDCFDINLQILKDYLYSSAIISCKLDLYSEIPRNKLFNKRIITKYLSENYNKTFVKDVLNTHIRDYWHYIISYLSAIELYLIYQKNPQDSLNILLNITKNKQDNNLSYLEYVRSQGIIPGNNFDKYIHSLSEKAKELNDEKSLRYKN